MNTKKAKTQTFVVALAMMLALAIVPTMTFGQEKDDNQSPKMNKTTLCGCQKVKGNLIAVDNSNGTLSGTITQGGRLNGTTLEVFTSAITPTPDPNAFSLTNDYTVTTRRGVLKTHNVGIFDIALGVFTDFARIDPNASTGDFAGATGVLYINGRATDGGATAEITGEICTDIAPPNVIITNPANNMTFSTRDTITIVASASSPNGIAKVEFYSGDYKLNEDTTAPYTYSQGNVNPGTYTVTAVATDSRGATTRSSPITVIVR